MLSFRYGNVSQWSSQVIGTPLIISEPFHCRGDKVLILLRYSSTQYRKANLPAYITLARITVWFFTENLTYWQRILQKNTLDQTTSLGMTTRRSGLPFSMKEYRHWTKTYKWHTCPTVRINESQTRLWK